MAKRKHLKEKSPIKLRSKKLANGNSSLYLDIYLNGERKKEYLKLYLVPETNTLLKEQNRKTLEIAETIKSERLITLQKSKSTTLQERREQDSFVFTLPKSIATTEMYLKVWTEFAGIDKHVTFHTARHSFAVNILTNGGDIYTLSKLLGHKKVATTQIYADVLEKTKQKTMDLLNSFEESDNLMK